GVIAAPPMSQRDLFACDQGAFLGAYAAHSRLLSWGFLPGSPFSFVGSPMEPALFDQLQETLASQGPHIAIERLCKTLRADKDYANLFYALLLKKRHELGVSPVPTESAQALPEAVHAPYEDAIREAGRLVGQLYLDAGDIPRAWMYFRMI